MIRYVNGAKITGFGEFVKFFTPKDELPPIEKKETPKERKARLRLIKMEEHKKVLEEREKTWDPHKNDQATKDAYKTLFVARLSYDVEEMTSGTNLNGMVKSGTSNLYGTEKASL